MEQQGRSLHSLRHTFALQEYLRTGDINFVKQALGHSHVTITERYLKIPLEYLQQVFGESITPYHAWDPGDCGVEATIAAAEKYGVTHAGTGHSSGDASRAAMIEVKGGKIALVAATTSRDERDFISPTESSPGVNGVWTGWREDWDRKWRRCTCPEPCL